MADKTSVKLNIAERFMLLQILPQEGDFTTLKIIRKLRETLAPDEKESEEYGFQYEYACKQRDIVDEKPVLCGFMVVSPIQPKCPVHNEYMQPSGRMFWKPEMATMEKQIFLGNKAKSLITEALEKLDDQKKLTEQHFSLYEKFVKTEKEEE